MPSTDIKRTQRTGTHLKVALPIKRRLFHTTPAQKREAAKWMEEQMAIVKKQEEEFFGRYVILDVLESQ